MSNKLTFATDLSGTKITLGNYYTPSGSYTNIYVFEDPKNTYTTSEPILSLVNDNKSNPDNIKYLNITYQLLHILDPFYIQDTNTKNFVFDEVLNIYNPIVDASGVFNPILKIKILNTIKNFSILVNSSQYNKIFGSNSKQKENYTKLQTASLKSEKAYVFDKNNYKPLLESYIAFLNEWLTIIKSNDPKDFTQLNEKIEKINTELAKTEPPKVNEKLDE